MLSLQTVESRTLLLLRKIMQADCLSETRLVGGTALALQYGHRTSVDLDLFGYVAEGSEEAIADALRQAGRLTIGKVSRNIKMYRVDNVKIDVVNYNYPWIDHCVQEGGLRLASPKDIAAMKINAIEGRGSKKDFIDLYSLLQHYTLDEILNFYQQKYPEHSLFRAVLSLTYFNDADSNPMPRMFLPTSWEEMKAAIQKEVEMYSNR